MNKICLKTDILSPYTTQTYECSLASFSYTSVIVCLCIISEAGPSAPNFE